MNTLPPTKQEVQPQPQPKKFWKESMQHGLECTSETLDEVATLFSLIQELMESEGPAHRARIKSLSSIGQKICEDWAGVVDKMGGDLDKPDSPFFH